jgi:hypothetical protein
MGRTGRWPVGFGGSPKPSARSFGLPSSAKAFTRRGTVLAGAKFEARNPKSQTNSKARKTEIQNG